MGGIFGTISKKSCVADLFYGTDYNSHLGTRRGGLATYSSEKGFVRSIHNLESSYFRTKFESTLDKFEGATSGIVAGAVQSAVQSGLIPEHWTADGCLHPGQSVTLAEFLEVLRPGYAARRPLPAGAVDCF